MAAEGRGPWGPFLDRYNSLVRETRDRMPELSPRLQFEVKRKAIHAFVAIAAVPLLMFLPLNRAILLALAVMLTITITHFVNRRRLPVMPVYKEVVHEPLSRVLDETRRPGEDFPWAPVTFGVSLIVTGVATHLLGLPKAFAYASFAILGFGDASSALIGVAYGRRRLPWNRRKSWEGTAAGVVGGFLTAVIFAGVDFSARGAVFPPEWFAVAFAGALVGAAIESLPHVQDNLFVPGGALAAMFASATALGVA